MSQYIVIVERRSIRNAIRERGLTITDAAHLLGVSRQALDSVLNGRSKITPKMAACLGRSFPEISPELLLQDRRESELNLVRAKHSGAFAIRSRHIQDWASQPRSRGELPELIRRLIRQGGNGQIQVGFPAGEEIKRKGWDGFVFNPGPATAYVPAGRSYWEVSTQANPRKKAGEDYQKRLAEADKDSSIVFVTARAWESKSRMPWEREKNLEGKWRKVRTLDVSDLEEWLEGEPAVAYWFGGLLGIRHPGIQPLEEFWEELRVTPRHGLTFGMVEAGRAAELEAFRKRLQSGPWPIQLVSDSVEESLAFVAAGLQNPSLVDFHSAVRVMNAETLRELIGTQQRRMILCVDADAQLVAKAADDGFRVVQPLARGAARVGSHSIDLPRIGRDLFVMPLARHISGAKEDQDIRREDRQEAERISKECGGSVTIYLSQTDAAFSKPSWACADNVPFLLAGGWEGGNAKDLEAIRVVAGVSYEVLEERVKQSGTLLHSTGSTHCLLAPMEAWSVLGECLTDSLLTRFRQLAIKVLAEPDSSPNASLAEQMVSSISGTEPRYSRRLRESVSQSLILLAITQDERGRPYVEGVVEEVMKDHSRAEVWNSLGELLPALAEAAPEVFLDALEKATRLNPCPLQPLFEPRHTFMGPSARGHYLVAALAKLAWLPEYFPRAVRQLARLVRLESGATEINKSQADRALQDVFRPWLPNTTASVEEQGQMLTALAKEEPDVTWALVLELQPRGSDTGGHTDRPKWRPVHKVERVTHGDRRRAYRTLIRLGLDLSKDNLERSIELLPSMEAWPPEDQIELIARYRTVAVERDQNAIRDRLWSELRDYLSIYDQAESDWVKPVLFTELQQICQDLAPQDLVEKVRWLFQDQFAGARIEDADAARRGAMRELVQNQGLEGVFRLVDSGGQSPNIAGVVLAGLPLANDLVSDLLRECAGKCDEPTIARFVEAYVSKCDAGWQKVILGSAAFATWPTAAKAAFCQGLPLTQTTWTGVIEPLGSEMEVRYWKSIFIYALQPGNVQYAIAKLFEVERFAAVLKVGGEYARQLTAEEAMAILERLSTPLLEGRIGPDSMKSYDVERLFDRLYTGVDLVENKVARLEVTYFPLRKYQHEPRFIHRFLEQSPEFFAELVVASHQGEPSESEEAATANDGDRRQVAGEILLSWTNAPKPPNPEFFSCGKRLAAWVSEAREKCALAGNGGIANYHVAAVLSRAPVDADGIWPHSAVRQIIEDLASDELDDGIRQSRVNSLGWQSRNEGSHAERAIAAKYRDGERQLGIGWPRTSRLLGRLKGDFEDWARYWDRDDEKQRFR